MFGRGRQSFAKPVSSRRESDLTLPGAQLVSEVNNRIVGI